MVSSFGYETTQKGKELHFKYCPYCSGGEHRDKDTFSINVETGAFKCLRESCGKTGHFVQLARDKDYKLDFGDTVKQYQKFENKDIIVRDEAVEYLKSRGISEKTAKKYSITVRNDNKKILVFPFKDDSGELVMIKYRKTNFVKGRDQNKEWSEKNCKPILFGMYQCKDRKRLIITEGQIDSLSVDTCGIDNAVSVPTGAMGFTWINHCYDFVDSFEEIIIFGDYEKGKISLVDGISQRFPKKKIKVVRPADYLGEKDANDILRKYGKEAVIDAVNNAEIKPIKAVKKLSDVKDVDLMKLPHLKTGFYDIDKRIGGLYLGQIGILTGKRGTGKSTLASQIMANILDQGESVFCYSGELPDYHFKNWLDLQIAGTDNLETYTNEYGETDYYIPAEKRDIINHWYDNRAFIFDNNVVIENDTTEISLLDTIETTACRYGIKFVLLDNLMTALDVEPDSNLYQAQSNFIKKCKRIATRCDIFILIVAHPRKEADGIKMTNDSVSGSADITNAVDMVFTYEGNTNEAEKEDYPTVIGLTKNRLTGKLMVDDNRLSVSYSEKCKRIASGGGEAKKVFSCFEQPHEQEIEGYSEIPF